MKRYLLGLRSGDFAKNGNVWTSGSINLYNNQFYKNYSYKRSSTGLNLIGDYTFVGTEVSSPSYSSEDATPIDDYAVYKTNYGEVVYDPATPDLLRFIDTSSRVDIVSYKHAFTNVLGTENPTFNLQIFESDSENGPWLKSALLIDSNAVFLNNVKPYVKIELEIFSALGNDLSELGLLLYVEVAIHEPVTPVISDSAINIAKRFPSWTQIFEDSFERATPELATPISNAGKFINALLGENLDNFTNLIDEFTLNSFISSADEDMIDWIYVSYGIPATASVVTGDGIQLAKAPSLEAFYDASKTDYIYYHNLVDGQVITLRKFDTLLINGGVYEQEPAMLYNIFDEFGTRVNLKRLYLEDNARFKKRILDVYANPPGVGPDAYKLTLRRELDIWKAYNATPDSNYLGATPEILEISDIENSTPYFSFSRNPQEKFVEFVRYINETYPSNLGYIKWDEGIWDYAGLNEDGIGRISAIYDTATPLLDLFQPGVGDFRDVQLIMPNEIPESATTSFTGRFKADGFKIDSYKDVYGPIDVQYQHYAGYQMTAPDPNVNNPNSATPFNGGVAIVYEIEMPAHTGYATPATYYANLSYNDRADFFVYNYYSQTSAASPEYNLIPIVNSDGLTDTNIVFRHKVYDYVYTNYAATPTNNSINISLANSVLLTNKVKWNPKTQSYVIVPTGNYRISFDTNPLVYYVNPLTYKAIAMYSPSINYRTANIRIGSTAYGSKTIFGTTDIVTSKAIINDDNDISKTKNYVFDSADLKQGLIFPLGATPTNIYVDNVKITPDPIYGVIQTTAVRAPQYGGQAYNPLDNNTYYVPSSPNIIFSAYTNQAAYNSNSATYTGYFESATFNYNLAPQIYSVSTGLSATPYYPFKMPVWVEIGENELLSTPMLNGYIDHLGNVYKETELIEDSGRSINSKIKDTYLDSYELSRETFGINSAQKDLYLITHINPISNTQEVELTSDKNEVLPAAENPIGIVIPFTQSSSYIEELYDVSSNNYYYSEIQVNAKKIKDISEDDALSLEKQDPSLHTGWLYLPENDYYVYSHPVTDIFNGALYSADLSDDPRQGAPIIVDVIDNGATVQYTELMYPDTSTPGNPIFQNTEYVNAANDRALYLSYSAPNNITINDTYTGLTLVENPIQIGSGFYIWTLIDSDGNYIWDFSIQDEYYIINLDHSLEGNRLEILSTTTGESILIPGRLYEVTYTIDNAFYVDKNVYNEISDEYYSKIYFSSTPDYPVIYNVTYETSLNDFSTPSGISLSSVDLPISTGFVYVSDEEYKFGTASVTVSPNYISDSSDNFVYLTITSYDENKNLKPNQTFYISSSLLTPDSPYLTTNEYGFASTKLYYSGAQPTNATSATINVQGLLYSPSTPVIDKNSSASPYFESIDISVNRLQSSSNKLKAAAARMVIKSDGITDNIIRGQMPESSIGSTPVVYWRKARSVYSSIEDVNYSISTATPGAYNTSGAVFANTNGEFAIGPFYSQSRDQAGYWFVTVESALSTVLSSTPTVLVGDIVYWYESYDNISYDTEVVPLPNIYNSVIQQNSQIIENPAFKFNHYDMEHSESQPATVNWNPPKWLPISYYTQYQMGAYGATPNVVSTYSNLINDYEES